MKMTEETLLVMLGGRHPCACAPLSLSVLVNMTASDTDVFTLHLKNKILEAFASSVAP